MTQAPFTKPPLSISDQVSLLRNRGMNIPNQPLAEEALLRLNYYRFSGYALHYEIFHDRQRTHRFKPGTTFDQVIEIYEFDTRLRALLFRYIEPIEVAFRAIVCYELSIQSGNPHWYLESNRYDDRFDFLRLMEECQRECTRSDEIFIKNYQAKYKTPPLPPAWMMSEILSIGRWSMIFKHLVDNGAKKTVAYHFATKPYFFESWLHSVSVLRNLCAHHCRIWNRNFTISPALPHSLQSFVTNNAKLAALIIVLIRLLKPLGKNIEFQRNWNVLLAAFPNVPPDKMGFASPTLMGTLS